LVFTCFGENVNLPVVTQYQEKIVTRLLEIRYIGACKERDDGSSVAFGLVGRDWSVIIPEPVLMGFFDAPDSLKTETTTKLSTLYQVLGIRQNCTDDEVKSGYRRMVKQWHPDVCREPNAAEMFIQIQNAYSILSDNGKRARYDAGLFLQAEYEKDNKTAKTKEIISGYRSPLRCGLIMFEGIEKLGRIEVSKILAWEDITNNLGQTLVVSWPMGAKEPVEIWN
jgi:hypothetical protein